MVEREYTALPEVDERTWSEWGALTLSLLMLGVFADDSSNAFALSAASYD